MRNYSKPKYSKRKLIVDPDGHFCTAMGPDPSLNLWNVAGTTLLCLQEVAYLLRVSRRTVERLCHDGKLLYAKVNRAVRIAVVDLRSFIEANRVVIE